MFDRATAEMMLIGVHKSQLDIMWRETDKPVLP